MASKRMSLSALHVLIIAAGLCVRPTIAVPLYEEGRNFPPFIWPSQPPADCPFEPSKDIVGIAFTGVHSDYHVADTWYPSWASDGNLYSPWTDGSAPARMGLAKTPTAASAPRRRRDKPC